MDPPTERPADAPLSRGPRPSAPRWSRWAAAFAVALGWLSFALPAMGHYGVTSDSPSLFYAGDRHVFWLTHPTVPAALDLLAEDDPPGFQTAFFRFPEFADPVHYPVFPGLVASGAAALTRGLLSPIDGHHLGLVLLQAGALAAFTFYGIGAFGLVAGVAGGLSAAFFPCLVGHAFDNAKDLPCAMFYGAALLAFALGVLEDRSGPLVAFGVLLGLAFSAKLNALFALVSVAGWAPLAYTLRKPGEAMERLGFLLWSYLPPLALGLFLWVAGLQLWWVGLAGGLTLLPLLIDLGRSGALSPRTLAAALLSPLIALALFVFLWPWLWAGQSETFLGRLHLYLDGMLKFSHSERASWTDYPLRCLWGMSPPAVLALATVGVLALLLIPGRFARPRRESLALAALLLIWVGLPLLRIALPYSMFYDANRHFLEYVPGLAMASGVGFAAILSLLHGAVRPSLRLPAQALWTAASLGLLAWPIAAYHPYEVTYFSPLVGGLGGAEQSGYLRQYLEDWRTSGTEGDYWHSSARDFLRHLGTLIPDNAVLGTCGTSPEQLIANAEGRHLTLIRQPYEADYVYVAPRQAFCGWHTAHLLERTRPVLERITRGGGLIYEILGPEVPYPLPSVSPHTRYDPPSFTEPGERP